MTSIILTCSAFALHALYDWSGMYRIAWRRVLFYLAAVSFLIGLPGIFSTPPEIEFVYWLRVLAWIFLLPFLVLLVYSDLIEIPLKTYKKGSNIHHVLVDTGTFALTRHPGGLWFTVVCVCLIIIHPSQLVLNAVILWTIFDFLLIWAEDRYFLPNTFPGYIDYKKSTPFIIPNKASLRRCLETFKDIPKNQ